MSRMLQPIQNNPSYEDNRTIKEERTQYAIYKKGYSVALVVVDTIKDVEKYIGNRKDLTYGKVICGTKGLLDPTNPFSPFREIHKRKKP